MSSVEKGSLHQSFEEFAFEGGPDSLARFVSELVTRHEAWIFIRFKAGNWPILILGVFMRRDIAIISTRRWAEDRRAQVLEEGRDGRHACTDDGNVAFHHAPIDRWTVVIYSNSSSVLTMTGLKRE